MFVGYATKHAGDYYRMFNEDTLKVHLTRDVRRLNRIYYKLDGNKNTDIAILDDDDDEIHFETVDTNDAGDNDNELKTNNTANVHPTQTVINQNVIELSDDENEASDSDDNESKEGHDVPTIVPTVEPVPIGVKT